MALLAELPDAVGPLMAALADRAARESDVARLLDALGPLARARRYGDVRSTDTGALAEVVDGLVVRAVVGLRGACRGLDDDEAAAMAERLQSAQSALVLIDHPARADDWPQALGELVDGDGIPGAVAGRAARLLHDAGWWSPPRIGAELARTLSVGTPPARARRLRRRLRRRQRHGPAPRRGSAPAARRLGGRPGRERLRRRRAPAAPDVRRLRGGRTPTAGPAGRRPAATVGRPRRSVGTSTRPGSVPPCAPWPPCWDGPGRGPVSRDRERRRGKLHVGQHLDEQHLESGENPDSERNLLAGGTAACRKPSGCAAGG